MTRAATTEFSIFLWMMLDAGHKLGLQWLSSCYPQEKTDYLLPSSKLDVCSQIPQNTNVIFCQPTDQKFDFVALHGFLPLQGLEVPLMVLQTRVFFVVLLQNYTPYVHAQSSRSF
jgi:hypothetical protein